MDSPVKPIRLYKVDTNCFKCGGESHGALMIHLRSSGPNEHFINAVSADGKHVCQQCLLTTTLSDVFDGEEKRSLFKDAEAVHNQAGGGNCKVDEFRSKCYIIGFDDPIYEKILEALMQTAMRDMLASRNTASLLNKMIEGGK